MEVQDESHLDRATAVSGTGPAIVGVSSPGGTTTRALHALKNGRFSAVLTEAVDAAYVRSRELGDELEAKLEAGAAD